MATVAALFGIEESRTLWAVWGTTQLHIDGYRSVRSREWLVTFRSSSSDNPWTSLVNHPCLCLIAPISQHIMLSQSTVATALIFNWAVPTKICIIPLHGSAPQLFFIYSLLSTLILLFLPSSSTVSLSYFYLDVPIRRCLGKTLAHECPIFYSHTEWDLALFGHQFFFVVQCLLSNN